MKRKNVVFLLLSLCFVTVVYIQSFQEVSKSFQIFFVSNKKKNTFNSAVAALRSNNSDVKTILVWDSIYGLANWGLKMEPQKDYHNQTFKQPKVILVWNGRYGRDNWGFSRQPYKDFVEMGCSVCNCVVTDDKKKLAVADAVMFHVVDGLKDHPKTKYKHQRWVFYGSEAPCGTWKDILNMNNKFNWTQTFRTDADIPSYYGHTCKRNKTVDINFKNILKTKNKLVAWMVSNCKTPSRRIEYVRELMKYIQIDVYGGCASRFNQNNICKERKECLNMIGRNYKFYLSFENSFTKDYISEKYYNISTVNTIPVVRGDGNYTALVAPKSFINTKDFSSPKHLANYLLYLHGNDSEYVSYLEWKKNFINFVGDRRSCSENPLGWCTLCKKLNDPNEPTKHYEDIRKWFGSCRVPNDI